MDQAVAEFQRLAAIIDGSERGRAGIEAHRDRNNLENGAQFVAIDSGMVALFGITEGARPVEIEIRPARQGQHLAGTHICDDADRALRPLRHSHGAHFILQRPLDAQVHGERHRLVGRGIGGNLVLHGLFRAGHTLAAALGHADIGRPRIGQRIIAHAHGLETNARQAIVEDFIALGRLDIIGQQQPAIHLERLVDLIARQVRKDLQQGTAHKASVIAGHVVRIDEQAVIIDIRGQQLPVAVNELRPCVGFAGQGGDLPAPLQ
ncbi:hypothetical protein ASTA108788_00970 [Asticcacaulis taihuensis]